MKNAFLMINCLVAVVMLHGCGESVQRPEPELITGQHVPDSGNLLVHCGSLIDGRSDTVQKQVVVLIEQGRISAIGPTISAPESIPRLDLTQHTCLPGLIEMHSHILESHEELVDLTLYYDYSLEDNLERGRQFSRETLAAGFTTVRNLGAYFGWAGRALREEINGGETVGPRLQIAGFYLTVPGGGGDLLEVGGREADIPSHLRLGVSRSADEFRNHAQQAVDGGADVLKVIASGAVLAYGGKPGAPEMTPADLEAVAGVAREAGVPVTAHAHGAQSIREAILAGASTIEHATYIDREGIELAIEHDVALVMDIGPGDWMIEEGRRAGWVEEFLRKTIETTVIQRENFRKAHAAGVTILYGTDAGIYPHGMNGIQFAYMVEWGMSPMEAIQAATSLPARYLGWEDRIGALEPGLMGDLVAVRGNPLEDVSLLEDIDVVIKGGLLFNLPESP